MVRPAALTGGPIARVPLMTPQDTIGFVGTDANYTQAILPAHIQSGGQGSRAAFTAVGG